MPGTQVKICTLWKDCTCNYNKLLYSVSCDKWIKMVIWSSVTTCKRWIDQHDTRLGQRKNLSPQKELNPWPSKHQVGAQWIELPPGVQEVMGLITVRDSDFFLCPMFTHVMLINSPFIFCKLFAQRSVSQSGRIVVCLVSICYKEIIVHQIDIYVLVIWLSHVWWELFIFHQNMQWDNLWNKWYYHM